MVCCSRADTVGMAAASFFMSKGAGLGDDIRR